MVVSLCNFRVEATVWHDSGDSTGVIVGEHDDSIYSAFSQFTDVYGHWAYNSLWWSCQQQMLEGYNEHELRPNANVTRAQLATIVARAFGAVDEADMSVYSDVYETDWCYSTIAKAIAMDVLLTFGNSVRPSEAVSREEVCYTLVKAAGYELASESYLNDFIDEGSISDWARPYVATAVQKGLVFGYPNGTFGPSKEVTRAELVTMMKRMAIGYMNSNYIFTDKEIEGSLAVGLKNISLDNMDISDNLFLADGIQDGDVKLNNTTVNDTIYMKATGANSLHLWNNTQVGDIVVINDTYPTHIDVDKTSSAKSVYIREATDSVALSGDVGSVTVSDSRAPVTLQGATVSVLDIVTSGAAVVSDAYTTIGTLIIEDSAILSEIDIAGSVGSLIINGNNSTINVATSLSNLSFGPSVSAVNLTLPETGAYDSLVLPLYGMELTLGGTINSLTISGEASNITLAENAQVGEVAITGKRCTFTVPATASVGVLDVTGDSPVLSLASSNEYVSVTGDDAIISLTGSTSDLQVDSDNANITLEGKVGLMTIEGQNPILTSSAITESASILANNVTASFTSAVDSLAVDGKDIKVTLGSDCKSLSTDGENIEITAVGNVSQSILDGDNVTVTYNGTANDLNIFGTNVTVNLDKGAKNIDVEGASDVTVNLSDVVDNVSIVDSDKVTINGTASAGTVTAKNSKDIEVNTPLTTVTNSNSENVTVASIEVKDGSTVTSDSTGTGDKNIEDMKDVTYIITSSAGTGGTINPSGPLSTKWHTSQTYNFTADTDYAISDVIIDNVSVGPISTYTFKNIEADHTIYVSFVSTVKQKPVLKLQWPVGAMPSDFGADSAYTLNSFGHGFYYDSSSGALTGVVDPIEDFYWYSGQNAQYATGYYVPLVLTSSVTTDEGKLTVGDAVFYNEVVSTGLHYKGYWIVYLAVDPYGLPDPVTGLKQIAVSYDPDGEGTEYEAETVYVDYSGLEFSAWGSDNSLYEAITAVPGYHGAETATVEYEESTTETVSLALHTEELMRTPGPSNVYGNWTGIRIPLADGADSAMLQVWGPDGSYNAYIAKGTSDSEEENATPEFIEFIVDVSTITTDSKTFKLHVSWRNGEEYVLPELDRYIEVDFSDVKYTLDTLNGDSVASDIMFTTASDYEVYDAGLVKSEICSGYSISIDTITGNFYPLARDMSGYTAGTYYIPVKISAICTEDTVILYQSIQATTESEETTAEEEQEGSYITESVIIGSLPASTLDDSGELVPVSTVVFIPQTGTILDMLPLVFTPVDEESEAEPVIKYLYTTDCVTRRGNIVLQETTPTAEETEYIKYPVYTKNGTALQIYGTLVRKPNLVLGDFDGYLWVAPVVVTVTTAEVGCYLKVESAEGNFGTYPVEDAASGVNITVLVPFGCDDAFVTNPRITLYSSADEAIETASVSFGGDMEEFTGGGTVIPSNPVVEQVSLVAITTVESLADSLPTLPKKEAEGEDEEDGDTTAAYTLSDFVDMESGTYKVEDSVPYGTLKKVALTDGSYIYYLPIKVQVQKAVESASIVCGATEVGTLDSTNLSSIVFLPITEADYRVGQLTLGFYSTVEKPETSTYAMTVDISKLALEDVDLQPDIYVADDIAFSSAYTWFEEKDYGQATTDEDGNATSTYFTFTEDETEEGEWYIDGTVKYIETNDSESPYAWRVPFHLSFTLHEQSTLTWPYGTETLEAGEINYENLITVISSYKGSTGGGDSSNRQIGQVEFTIAPTSETSNYSPVSFNLWIGNLELVKKEMGTSFTCSSYTGTDKETYLGSNSSTYSVTTGTDDDGDTFYSVTANLISADSAGYYKLPLYVTLADPATTKNVQVYLDEEFENGYSLDNASKTAVAGNVLIPVNSSMVGEGKTLTLYICGDPVFYKPCTVTLNLSGVTLGTTSTESTD